MDIIIGADHLGVYMQDKLINYLNEKNINLKKVEINNNGEDDYTDFAFAVSEEVTKNQNSLGILICGNGIGMSIAANKVKGIRCARVLSVDDAFKCKNHNGANIISLSSEVDFELTKKIVDTFINTDKATKDRYMRRITKIINYEEGISNEL